MKLAGDILEKLVAIVTETFNKDSLRQFVYFKLGADMYKEWVPDGKTFKTDVFNLLTKLAEERLLASFLDHFITKREDLSAQIIEIRTSLEVQGTTTQAQATAIKTSVAGVEAKLQLAPVRQIVMRSRGVLAELTAKIELLRAYKLLHDDLHIAKMQFGHLESTARKMKTDATAASDFSHDLMSLETLATCVQGHVQDLPDLPAMIRQDEFDWLARFTEGVIKARQAADGTDHVTARQGLQVVRSVLRTEPSRIDARLSRAAHEIDLANLKDVFTAAALLPELAEDSAMLEQGRAATEQLLRQVKAQIHQHNSWQNIDRYLAGADEIMRTLTPEEPSDFDALWKGMKEEVTILESVEAQSEWAKKITKVISDVDATRTANDFKKLPEDFDLFRREATFQFFAVDTKLKMLATEVNAIGAPLRSLLNKL